MRTSFAAEPGTSASSEAGVPTRVSAWSPDLGRWRAVLLAAPLVLLLALFVLYPLVRLMVDSLTAGKALGNYSEVFKSPAGRRSLATTLFVSAIVAALSALIGGVIAWRIRTTTSTLLRAVLWLSLLVPFWMGTVVKNYAIVLLVANNGALNDVLESLGLGHIRLLYTSRAVLIGMVYTMVPYAALSLYGVFMTIDQSLPLAARSLGASRLRVMTSIILPLALPGIIAGTALVFAISVGFYVTPVLLGGAQTPFMATYIQDHILTFFDYPVASAASVVLLVAALGVLGVALALVGKKRMVRAMVA